MNIGMKNDCIIYYNYNIFIVYSYKFINDKTEGNWIIKVVDNNTGEE